MKKIINGKKYDTDTAKRIGRREENPANNLDYFFQTLYRKKTGEFFLLGEGGPRTIYGQPSESGGWRSGEKIIPLSYEDAQEWAEEYLTADEYEATFGAVSEGDGSAELVPLSVTAQAREVLRQLSSQTGEKISSIASRLIIDGASQKKGGYHND